MMSVVILMILLLPFISQAACCSIPYTYGFYPVQQSGTYTTTTYDNNCLNQFDNLKNTFASSQYDNIAKTFKCSILVDVGFDLSIEFFRKNRPDTADPFGPGWTSKDCSAQNITLPTTQEFQNTCVAAHANDNTGIGAPNDQNTGQGAGNQNTGSGANDSQPNIPSLSNPLRTTNIAEVIGRVIKAFLLIVGSLALLMFVYGGLTWMTATGNDQRVTKGRDILIWATLGLVVIFSAYLLIRFVMEALKVG